MDVSMKNLIKKSYIGTEELLKYGGFVEEALREQYGELYPESVIRFSCAACGMTREFWKVADILLEIYEDERGEFLNLCSFVGESKATKFYNWFFQKAAIYERDRIRSGDMTLSEGPWDEGEIKRALKPLCTLDKRIAILRYGLDGEGLKRPEVIAKLPEFDCETSYIEKRLTSIDEKSRVREIVFKKFEVAVKKFEHHERIKRIRGGKKND